MKRYLLFAGSSYYPAGGWSDLAGNYDTLAEAVDAAVALKDDWYKIIDTTTMEPVKEWIMWNEAEGRWEVRSRGRLVSTHSSYGDALGILK